MTYIRTIIHICLIGLLLTACSSDPIDPQPEERLVPICIGGGEQADMTPVTRADSRPLKDDFQTFKLWGYKTMGYTEPNYTNHQNVMDQYIVQWHDGTAGSTTTNTAGWEYVGIQNDYAAGPGGVQTTKYWDFYASSYRFFAFAPHDESKVEYGESGNKQPVQQGGYWWYNISFDADAKHPELAPLISKLWFSNGNPIDYSNHLYGQTVTLEFLKPVTRVRIRLIDAEGKTIDAPQDQGFTDLKFAPANGDASIVQKGKLKVSYALTGPATVANYLPQVEVVGSPVGTVSIDKIVSGYDDWYYVLPHVEQGDYKLTGHIGSAQKEATVPKEYMSWFPNMEYTYIFKITDHDFQFIDIVQIGVTEWQTENLTHDIYNW